MNSVLGLPKHRGHGWNVGIANHADALHAGNQFDKQFHQLGTEIDRNGAEASDIASPAYAGTDFIIARDGKIGDVYLFFDELP